MCFVLYGCGTSEIVVRKLELNRPAMSDTIAAEIIQIKNPFDETLLDTIYKAELLRLGSTEHDAKEVAATAEFNPKTKKFFLEVPAIKDIVIIHDTLKLKPTDIIIRGNTITEKIIWIISLILTSITIIIYKRYTNVNKSAK